MFFSKEKSQINILNDLDNDVVERLKLLQKAPLNPNEYINDLNTIPKLTYFYNNHSNSIYTPYRAGFVSICCLVFQVPL